MGSVKHAPAPPEAAAGNGSDIRVEFAGVDKSYDGRTLVVNDLNLSIRKGEFVTLLGPSGSGKTTILMMLAGFQTPTAGTIRIDGRSVEDLPPRKRGIGMVFQNYALFPHMTVGRNLAFPWKYGDWTPRSGGNGWSARSAWCASRVWRTGGPGSSREGSNSGWRSRARWSSNPTWC